jgi:Caspase domain
MAPAPQMGGGVIRKSPFLIFALGLLLSAIPARAAIYYVTVAGLGGEPDYEQEFTSLALDLNKLLKSSGTDVHVYTLTGKDATRARMTQVLGEVAGQAKPSDDFVLILIGHGTYDGVDYKFNLVGPDITAAELASLCDRIPSGRQLIVNTTSASGGSVMTLEKRGRAVIAATKTGTEKNATVFARYWVEALHDPETDLDKNEGITALEVFQYATRKTAGFYESQKRLATEHAIFEDTGQHDPVRLPTPETGEGRLLSNFTLIRFGAAQKAYNDPAKRDLLAKKEELERQIDTLKYQKAAMAQDDYKQQLTAALVALAKVQAELDK